MSQPVSPTTFSPALSQEFNAKVYLKPEIHSATGSYKDRMAPAAVAEALHAGAKKAVVTSSGNQGIAIAHAAQAAGLPVLVIATQHILPFYRDELRRFGAELQIVPDMKARSDRFHGRAAEGYFPLSVVPEDRGLKVQAGKNGYAAIAREIVAALGAAPDFLILPVCFGDGCSGILRGFQEMARARGTGIAKFIMVRARNTEDVAFSITADITTPEVEATLEATQGVSMYFTNAEFLEAQRLGRREGLDLEPAAAGPFLALRKLAAAPPGIPPGSSVVLLLTAVNRT
jgi:threonine synthase